MTIKELQIIKHKAYMSREQRDRYKGDLYTELLRKYNAANSIKELSEQVKISRLAEELNVKYKDLYAMIKSDEYKYKANAANGLIIQYRSVNEINSLLEKRPVDNMTFTQIVDYLKSTGDFDYILYSDLETSWSLIKMGASSENA